MHLSNPQAIQAKLKAAEDDFRASVERLINQHAGLRDKRASGG
jgi:hypothetical protein